ncbi:restriction endonuclease subunit S [Candidatus Gracilibacteria bacterium]|nr:restriction endonuclease subunit S [Candidatus Gracilibacteria bacterium]
MPNEWKKEKIASIGEVVSGATPKTMEPSYWDGSLVWVTPKDLSRLNSAYIDTSERKITDAGFESCSAAKLPVNSLIMSSRAPIGYLAINRVPATTNQGCKSIIPKAGVSTEYLYYYLTQNIDDVKRLGTGSTFAEVGKSAVESVEILVPPIAEQKSIADILLTVDEEIQRTEAIICAAEKLRTGLMFVFFVEEPRRNKANKYSFKEVLESIIDHRGLTPKKLGGDWSSQGIPTISAMNVKNGRIVKPDEIRFVDEDLYKKWMPEEIREGDVLLTSEAPLGQTYVVKSGEKFCLSQRLFGLRPNPKKISGEYLYYFLTSPIGEKRLFDRATGSTAKGIRQTELLKVEINPPNLLRQKEIISILTSVDEKISVNQIIKEKLEILKKGLMADLLSGSVRVL